MASWEVADDRPIDVEADGPIGDCSIPNEQRFSENASVPFRPPGVFSSKCAPLDGECSVPIGESQPMKADHRAVHTGESAMHEHVALVTRWLGWGDASVQILFCCPCHTVAWVMQDAWVMQTDIAANPTWIASRFLERRSRSRTVVPPKQGDDSCARCRPPRVSSSECALLEGEFSVPY